MNEIPSLIEDFLLHCKFEKNLSPLTLKAYQIDLKQFQEFVKKDSHPQKTASELDKTIIREYLKEIFPHNKPKTIKRKLATLKAFMNHLEYEDIITVNPFNKLRLSIKEGKQLPKTIDIKNIKKLFYYLYNKKKKLVQKKNSSYKILVRDIAVLELLFATGIRVSELSNLKLQNFNIFRGIVLIKGKGNRERIIPIPHLGSLNALNNYYKLFEAIISRGDYFFVNRLGNRLSEQSVRLMIHKHVQALSMKQHITPHMFRHSVATLLLENGVDIRYIQNILGHSSINTTQIYAQVNEVPKRKILEIKHPRIKFNLE